jgi:hypothetical protein
LSPFVSFPHHDGGDEGAVLLVVVYLHSTPQGIGCVSCMKVNL